MLSKFMKVLSTIWSVVSVIVPLAKAVLDITQIVEEKELPEDRGSEEERDFIIAVIDVIYDLANEFVELPLPKDKVISAAEKIHKGAFKLFDGLNFFRKAEE